MKLTIDPDSNLSLKPLLAVEISKKEVKIIHQKTEDKQHCSGLSSPPLLEFPNERVLFSPNVITRYLMSDEKSETDPILIDEWLEWESSYLQPYLHRILLNAYTGGKLDPSIQDMFSNCMKKLETSFTNKYITGSTYTVVDVVIWSALYPLASDSKLANLYLKDFSFTLQWFNHLAEETAFKNILNTLTKGKGATAFKAAFLNQAVPYFPLSFTQSESPNSLQNKSPLHKSDTTDSIRSRHDTEATEDQEEILFSSEQTEEAFQNWLHGSQKLEPPIKRVHPILPKDGQKNILITSALPYVNNVPHLGNIIGCVLSADVFARYCRLRNINTLYVSGTDEYGTATETKAMQEGSTPREICDKYNKLHSEIYQWFDISFDYFGRTTTQQQTQIAQDIFWRLHQKNYLLEDIMDQQLCPRCDRFLADRFIEGICPFCGYEEARGDQCDKCGKLINAIELKSPKCQMCKETPIVKTSKHLFLNLPKLEPTLLDWYNKSTSSGLWTNNAKVITKSWIKDGLKPRCITRDLKWGTTVPLEGYTDKVFYVWFDAPIGYLSITANYTDEWELWWKNPSNVELFQFMAKDNVPFHGIIFPSTQLGADDNYTVVSHLVATEYLNYEDGKFSKSRGVGVFGDQAKDTGIPADIWRFYLLYVRPESQDSVFSWADLMTKNNSELLNNLGNFINRGLMFLFNNFNGIIPEMVLIDTDKAFIARVAHELQKYLQLFDKIRIRDAIRHILNISRCGNQYIQSNKPWVLVKGTPEEKARAGSIMGLCANVSYLLSVMLQPYMPGVSRTIQEQLQIPPEYNIIPSQFVCCLFAGHKIGKPSPLFQKLEAAQMETLKKKFAGVPASKESSPIPVERKPEASPVPSNKIISSAGVIKLSVEELTVQIAAQGDVVRQLKTNKAEKADIDLEVAKLLELKRQLAIASGQNPDEISQNKKKKGKK